MDIRIQRQRGCAWHDAKIDRTSGMRRQPDVQRILIRIVSDQQRIRSRSIDMTSHEILRTIAVVLTDGRASAALKSAQDKRRVSSRSLPSSSLLQHTRGSSQAHPPRARPGPGRPEMARPINENFTNKTDTHKTSHHATGARSETRTA